MFCSIDFPIIRFFTFQESIFASIKNACKKKGGGEERKIQVKKYLEKCQEIWMSIAYRGRSKQSSLVWDKLNMEANSLTLLTSRERVYIPSGSIFKRLPVSFNGRSWNSATRRGNSPPHLFPIDNQHQFAGGMNEPSWSESVSLSWAASADPTKLCLNGRFLRKIIVHYCFTQLTL